MSYKSFLDGALDRHLFIASLAFLPIQMQYPEFPLDNYLPSRSPAKAWVILALLHFQGQRGLCCHSHSP